MKNTCKNRCGVILREMNVRVPKELHKKIKADAALCEITLEQWVKSALLSHYANREKAAVPQDAPTLQEQVKAANSRRKAVNE